jgi:hypothetical protein
MGSALLGGESEDIGANVSGSAADEFDHLSASEEDELARVVWSSVWVWLEVCTDGGIVGGVGEGTNILDNPCPGFDRTEHRESAAIHSNSSVANVSLLVTKGDGDGVGEGEIGVVV